MTDPYKKSRHRAAAGMHTYGEEAVHVHSKQALMYRPRREAPAEGKPANTWILDFQLPKLRFLLFKPRWFQQCFVVVKAALPNKYIYAHTKMPLRSGRISYGFSYGNGHDLAVCLQSHRACKVVSLLGIHSPLSSSL